MTNKTVELIAHIIAGILTWAIFAGVLWVVCWCCSGEYNLLAVTLLWAVWFALSELCLLRKHK